MRSKLKDVKLALSLQLNKKHRLEKINKDDGRSDRQMKEWRKKLCSYERKKKERYEKKIEHYKKKHHNSAPVNKDQKRIKKAIKPTVTPEHLWDFRDISVLGPYGRIPKPLPPVGPCIYDNTIILSKEELEILSKNPIYSVCQRASKIEFQLN